jgi:hypothetical protein
MSCHLNNRTCRTNNCPPTASPQTAICQRDCDPLLQLTSSITESAAAEFSSLSPDGTRVLSLLTFFIGSQTAIPVDMRLYENNCGTLIPIASRLPSDASDPTAFISLAAVATDWKIAAGIYENADASGNPLGTGFVDLFNPNNPSVNLKTFPIVLPAGVTQWLSFTVNTDYLQGISIDDRYLTVTFQTSSFPNSLGYLQIYDLVTGAKVAETTIGGFSNGGAFFDLCQKKSRRKCKEDKCIRRRFVAINYFNSEYPSALDCSGIRVIAPSVFAIYEFTCGTLIKITQDSVSSSVGVISIPRGLCCPPEILIAITAIGQVPGAPSFFSFPDPELRDTLNGEPGGVTIYRFNGKKLKQVAFQPVELGNAPAVGFTANGKYLAISFSSNIRAPSPFCGVPVPGQIDKPTNPAQVSFAYPGYFQIFRVVNQITKDGCECDVCLYPVDIPRPTPLNMVTLPFSLNGRWFLISGGLLLRPSVPVDANGDPLTPIPTTGPINNVQLYRVVLPEGCPYQDEEDPIECIKQNACDLSKACDQDECVPFKHAKCSQQNNICCRRQHCCKKRHGRY